MTHRQYSIFDKLCLGFDQTVRALFENPQTTGRIYPGEKQFDNPSENADFKNSARLMRVNHSGEVCAQALYQGQALVCRDVHLREALKQAALEEGDHLAWCSQRLAELGSHTSYLNPLWYTGSFMIGLTAGLIGDRWSLGFLAETETQVIKHLESHIQLLPKEDLKSREILQQMQADEASHRQEALDHGAAFLPEWMKKCMHFTSRIMVKLAYWI